MALGLLFGRDRVDDWAGWRACLIPAREFCARFVGAEGSTQCGDLLEKHFGQRFDLGDPTDLAKYQAAQPGPTEVCGGVVCRAVRLAAEVIFEERQRRAAIARTVRVADGLQPAVGSESDFVFVHLGQDGHADQVDRAIVR